MSPGVSARTIGNSGVSFHEREWRLALEETPPAGAHLVTVRRGYTHHGIYIGEGRVVHYSGLSRGWKYGPVEAVSVDTFAHGRPVWVRPHFNPRFDYRQVIERARSRLGENRYQMLSNNCEHFCEWCFQGENRSRQVEAFRSKPLRLLTLLLSAWERGLRRTVRSDSGPSGWAV